MGCGSSTLKGEKHEVEEAPKPMTKVNTNFSTINYDGATTARNNSVYAPHDEIRQHKPSAALSPLTEKDNPLTIDAASNPAAAVQPGTTTTSVPTTTPFENNLPAQTTHNPLAGEEAIKTEPYRDVTVSPTTTNVSAPLPESQNPIKSTQ